MCSGRTRSCALPGRRRGCRTFSPPPRPRCGRASTQAAGPPSPRSTRGACPAPRRRRAPGRRRARRAGDRLDTRAARERCTRTRQPSSPSVAGFYLTSGRGGGAGSPLRSRRPPRQAPNAPGVSPRSATTSRCASGRTRSRTARAAREAGASTFFCRLTRPRCYPSWRRRDTMRQTGVMLLGPTLAVLLTGCATKDFVRQMVSKSEVTLDAKIGEQGKRVDAQAQRLDEQAKTVDAHARQLDDMGARFTKLETTVDETGNIARRAGDVAGLVHRRLELGEPRAHVVELPGVGVHRLRLLVESLGLRVDALALLADLRVERHLALADHLAHEVLRRASREQDGKGWAKKHDTRLSHSVPPSPGRVATRSRKPAEKSARAGLPGGARGPRPRPARSAPRGRRRPGTDARRVARLTGWPA